MTKDEALKMAMRFAKSNILTRISGLHGENPLTGQEVFDACKESLEQPAEYLYVYKGSDIWLKDSLDIPSAGFLIGKIRLEK